MIYTLQIEDLHSTGLKYVSEAAKGIGVLKP